MGNCHDVGHPSHICRFCAKKKYMNAGNEKKKPPSGTVKTWDSRRRIRFTCSSVRNVTFLCLLHHCPDGFRLLGVKMKRFNNLR